MATIELTTDNVESTIDGNDIVLIDFWAPWCGPCKTFGPIFEAASEKYPDAVFAKVNTEDQPELAAEFQITAIPTLVIFREQIGLFAQPGALPPAALEEVIERIQSLDMNEVRAKLDAEGPPAE